MICGGENGTNGCHFAVFSKDIGFARHFVATRLLSHPPTLTIGVLVVLATPAKNQLVFQLAIQPIVGE